MHGFPKLNCSFINLYLCNNTLHLLREIGVQQGPAMRPHLCSPYHQHTYDSVP